MTGPAWDGCTCPAEGRHLPSCPATKGQHVDRDALLAKNQRLREDGYREGFDCGFTTAMAAVRQAIERDLAIHENMEIMRGRRPSEALAGDTE